MVVFLKLMFCYSCTWNACGVDTNVTSGPLHVKSKLFSTGIPLKDSYMGPGQSKFAQHLIIRPDTTSRFVPSKSCATYSSVQLLFLPPRFL